MAGRSRRCASIALLGSFLLTGIAIGAPGLAQELRVGVAADPVSVDPEVTVLTSGWAMLRHVYEPLLWRDDGMKLIPVLAESWRRVNDLTWRFTLRKGVRFHTGEPFTAAAVKYTIDRIRDPNNRFVNSQFRSYIAAIDKVNVLDDYTVEFVTKQPSRALLPNLTTIYILPPKLGASLGEKFGTQPTGTGPFRLVSYASNSQMVLEAFDGYWGTRPKVQRLVFRILPENATRLAALESGEVALIANLPPDAIDRVSKNATLKVLSVPSARIMFIALEADRPPFNNAKVREALNYAVDRDVIVNQVLSGRATVATGPMYPGIPFFHKGLKPYTHDVPRAKRLLAEAGYPNGLKIKFGFSNGRYLMDKQIGELLVGQLAQAGVEADYESLEWGSFFAARQAGKYDAYLYGFGGITIDPDFALQWFGRARFTKYANPRVDQLLADADRTTDDRRAAELYGEAQEILWRENPWVWLYYQPELYGASKKLTGFEPRPDEHFSLVGAGLQP